MKRREGEETQREKEGGRDREGGKKERERWKKGEIKMVTFLS